MDLKYFTSCALVLYLFVSVSSLDATKRSRTDFEDAANEQTPAAASAEDISVVCAVCQESISNTDDLRMLPCSHKFCISCLESWEQASDSFEKPPCPTCRAPFSRSSRWEPQVEPIVDSVVDFLRLFEQVLEEASRRPQLPLSGVLEEDEQHELSMAYNTRHVDATIPSEHANVNGRTLLTYACETANFALAKFLVRTAGADVTRADRRRRTPSAILNSMPQTDTVRAIKRIITRGSASLRPASPEPEFSTECIMQ